MLKKFKYKKSGALLLLVLTAGVLLSYLDVEDSIINHYYEFRLSETERLKTVGLSDYKASIQGLRLTCIDRNLSGITFNHDTNSLFLITNGPEEIIELSCNGICIRKIPLKGFRDTEGIVYIGQQSFGIIEERGAVISLIHIDKATSFIEKRAVKNQLCFDVGQKKNKGFEGIAYNPAEDAIYVVTEKSPMVLYKINGLSEKSGTSFAISIKKQEKIKISELHMEDLSGLHFDTASNNLIFLSDRSRLIAEVTLQGKVIGFKELEKGFSGLQADVKQAEGITIDKNRNIYVVSEPNLFYAFQKTDSKH
jgi:uncharacterized protein YjiK